ncbi:hypothetical protein L486_02035 [Kwoniella mangroviensis CBS 10435]|uniref:Uncharacterized protein n=2 Tax=Kwoniella mangrovensis TaxID=463800 RepID=A0A1B9J3K1_9TREE|nr:hypothetical protein L486_02035 [Kwoniella mangroviensis CBS 10435]
MQPHIKTEMEDWISRQDDAMDCDATHQVEDNVSEYEEVFKKVKEEDKGGDISSVKDADGEDSYDNSKLDIMLVDQQEEEYCSGSEFCLVDESSSESDGSLGEDDESEESSDVLTHAKKDKKGEGKHQHIEATSGPTLISSSIRRKPLDHMNRPRPAPPDDYHVPKPA